MIRTFLKRSLILCLFFMITNSWALSVNNNNLVTINGISFHLKLIGEKRIAENTYQSLNFNITHTEYPDSTKILYSSPEMDFTITLLSRSDFDAEAYLARSVADFKQEIYLHKLYLSLSFTDSLHISNLKGVQAINHEDESYNEDLIPYRDKVIQYSNGVQKFWIVASNYAECKNVETLTSKDIVLYDFQSHFFRLYYTSTAHPVVQRDTMYKQAGSNHEWSFLFFEEQPILLDINRWPNGKKAALSISNDADSETLNRLKAVYFGSNNPMNPKYLTEGFIANHIKVSNTVFGSDLPTLGGIWTSIMEAGTSIGYHTYSTIADSAGTNANALLHTLLPYNIRLWIDHAVPGNPEDVAFNGLNPLSTNYTADVINQSGIDYIWPGDTPPTNPFNAFDEVWRLPHIVYEAKTLNRPIYFFGRTRAEAWEYANTDYLISMKYQITRENLDNLIQENGLHLSYTHFCFDNSLSVVAFFIILNNGDYVIRPEVNDMLKMLDYYQQYRGLWVDTAENIFDRMLATEQVRVVNIQASDTPGIDRLTIANESSYDLQDLNFSYQDQDINIPSFLANSTKVIYVNGQPDNSDIDDQPIYQVNYSNQILYLKDSESSLLPPINVQIYNIRGQKVMSYKSDISQINLAIPFHGKATGIYFLKVMPETGKPKTLKVTVIN